MTQPHYIDRLNAILTKIDRVSTWIELRDMAEPVNQFLTIINNKFFNGELTNIQVSGYLDMIEPKVEAARQRILN